MAALKELLPPAKSSSTTYYDHSNDPWFKQRFSSSSEEEKAAAIKHKPVPPYMKRAGFVPRKVEDFGDGGAFPEIHVAQYPLDMGRNKSSKPGSKILPVTVDAHGNVAYDAIVKQNENAKKIVYTQQKDLIPKILKNDEDSDMEDDEDEQNEIEETTQETKAALEKIVNVRLSAAQPKNVPKQSSDTKYIKYKPSQQNAAFNSGAKERVIRMVEIPVDPLEPPKFKHKRVPKASGSPPVPVMHSPPRPVTVKDQQDWKIPPCISNWKNPKGYTIPLDKRLAADGRGLQDVQINDNFAKLSEALYVAEQKAREAVAMRSKVQKEMLLKEKERKEQELRALAQKARSERTGVAPPAAIPVPSERSAMDDADMADDYEQPRERERGEREKNYPKESREEREERLHREKIREERRRERERERRLEAKDAAMGKKSKITRDRDRDISEKVALGMASTKAGTEVMYDERLFNQEKGISSGFATDDQYNVYDKGLFTAQPTLSTLYRPKKDVDNETYGGADEQLEKIRKTDRFKPDRGFAGTSERSGPRDRPLEFENQDEADPFGLDQFLTDVKSGKKAMENVGSGGTMRASAGSSMRDGYEGGSGRTRIGFERGH
ncbi:SNW/SKI-interacting protein A-like [Arachis stenosperma]|uniref:SNW/SKI-interacting protein A-like n=1 Tax=Arachis stenosperma TaxID=217475 RepID=UPI0025AD3D4F|nr:SNW/SKI-interacting protein A-like [Arachis stenosperma]XP_057759642.1 SNW/SKI-interacting protein A-like [Arachis stenosperma]